MYNLKVTRYGMLNGSPVVEVSTWKRMPDDSTDPRCIELVGQEGKWFLLSINDAIIDFSSVEKIYAPDGSYTIPVDSDFWTPHLLPVRAGVTIIDSEQYRSEIENSIGATSPEISDRLLSELGII